MDVTEAIAKRRAYRSLEPIKITDDIIRDLVGYTRLAPSCFNKQPWRFVFVHNQEILKQLFAAIASGNEWTRAASFIIAVCSREEDDCVVSGRSYYLFDTGMAVAFLLLRATEMDLVVHPIAGFDEEKAKDILNVPKELTLITLLIGGKKSEQISPQLSTKMAQAEKQRPPRREFNQIAGINGYPVAKD